MTGDKAMEVATVTTAVIASASLVGTTTEQIARSVETNRNVTIQITNYSRMYTLANPRTHTTSGYCYNSPQPTFPPCVKEVHSFSKTAHTACGAVGVLTYQILTEGQECVGELVIMFSVPYDYIQYENIYVLGIFKPHIQCDDALFNQMYYEKGPFQREKGTGSCLTYSGKEGVVKGTMSPQGKSIMKVEFWDVKSSKANSPECKMS
ncbi:DELTA-actitoxin-Afr1c-like [Hoplias malabaricus]|uniref:DELTA-actitoxin-Afr1c-like n=1 Tax=Hoplias malabaricus TaxID=27720 RepID=UPI003462FEAF